ncbi:hypothetical protein INP57_03220 [Saccharopolyspora sp. HNM0986]|uniref:hypothetical protein n=1 Tax=Saccharopolyspora galaxeae TaxID=2781241 RepID=UPI00190D34AA|nr:hypothetical protein [Saccharopolyspora sp. HNM0986]MBK0865810.1 hypothetical protein [Saccharopolyspora sp. HNM0986]
MGLPHPYRCTSPVAYWIVGLSLHLRHATESRPGALPGGEWTPTLCGTWIRVPFDTPAPRRPRSESIAIRCTPCSEIVATQAYLSITWDF